MYFELQTHKERRVGIQRVYVRKMYFLIFGLVYLRVRKQHDSYILLFAPQQTENERKKTATNFDQQTIFMSKVYPKYDILMHNIYIDHMLPSF